MLADLNFRAGGYLQAPGIEGGLVALKRDFLSAGRRRSQIDQRGGGEAPTKGGEYNEYNMQLNNVSCS